MNDKDYLAAKIRMARLAKELEERYITLQIKSNGKPFRLKKEDFAAMVELALATGDKEWFMELTQKMKEVA